MQLRNLVFIFSCSCLREGSETYSPQLYWSEIQQHPQEELEVEILPEIVSWQWHKCQILPIPPPEGCNYHWGLSLWSSVSFYCDDLLLRTGQRSYVRTESWVWIIRGKGMYEAHPMLACLTCSPQAYFPKQSFLPDLAHGFEMSLFFFPEDATNHGSRDLVPKHLFYPIIISYMGKNY